MSDPLKYNVIGRANFACPWCDKASDLLDEKGLDHTVEKLVLDDLSKIADASGMNTVPIIYQGDMLIGGYQELVAHLAE